ncbi:unnamed protein product, partial [Sphagnum compactum]
RERNQNDKMEVELEQLKHKLEAREAKEEQIMEEVKKLKEREEKYEAQQQELINRLDEAELVSTTAEQLAVKVFPRCTEDLE